jgi:esterase/lipase
MSFPLKIEERFKYCEVGKGETIVLLHGLFGALSNFNELIEHFSVNYTVAIPLLPLYDLDLEQTTVMGMVDYIEQFIDFKKYDSSFNFTEVCKTVVNHFSIYVSHTSLLFITISLI